MLALVLHAAPLDVAEVVAVLEQPAEPVDRDRTFAVAAGGPRPQAGLGQLLAQSFVAVLSGGVQLEGQPDKPPANRVYLDGGDLTPFNIFPDVQVAERCDVDGAALGGFVGHLALDVFAVAPGAIT